MISRKSLLIIAACSLAGCSSGNSSGLGGHISPEKSEAALLKAGDIARDGGDLRSAGELYRQAATIAPKDPVPYDHLGAALFKSGAYAEAFEALRSSLARDPDNFVANRRLGKLALALGKPDQALAYFQAAEKMHGDDPLILNGIGVAQDALGDHTRAQVEYRKGMKLAPENLAIKNNYGLSLALAGDYRAAIATLSAVVADPRATAQNRQNLALAYGLAGDDINASVAARKDISDSDSASNQRYYAVLRAMDDRKRTQAVLGSEFGRINDVELKAGTTPDRGSTPNADGR
jgi:Flp pilus assembly protein TadD